MFDNSLDSFEKTHVLEKQDSANSYHYRYSLATGRFKSSLLEGKIFRLAGRILQRKRDLYDLNALKPELHVQGSCYAGLSVVPISAIIGSEGRTLDFDLGFHPRKEGGHERWVRMAMAYLACAPMPPVELIRIDEVYFVRDGHHRLSVARAFGQTAVDAEVIAWKASPPFPWQPGTSVPGRNLLAQRS